MKNNKQSLKIPKKKRNEIINFPKKRINMLFKN